MTERFWGALLPNGRHFSDQLRLLSLIGVPLSMEAVAAETRFAGFSARLLLRSDVLRCWPLRARCLCECCLVPCCSSRSS